MDKNSLILNFNDMLDNLQDKFQVFFPKIIFSIIVLLIGYMFARLAKYVAIRLIRYLQNNLKKRTSGTFKYINLEQSAKFVGTALFWIVMISTAVLISDILGLEIMTNWMESILNYAPNILAALLIVLIAIIVGRATAEVISSVSIKVGLNYGNTLGRIVHFLILTTAIIIAMDQIGIEVAILINLMNIIIAALLFGAALAFGLGSRTAVSNILATFYVKKMFKVGDHVKIDDIQGKIAKINATSVVINTSAGQVIVPSKIFSEAKSLLINQDQQK